MTQTSACFPVIWADVEPDRLQRHHQALANIFEKRKQSSAEGDVVSVRQKQKQKLPRYVFDVVTAQLRGSAGRVVPSFLVCTDTLIRRRRG